MATLGNFTAGQVLTAAELNAIAAPTSFTPTWTNLTVGNGDNTGVYYRVQDLIFMQVQLTFGSTTSISGTVTLDLPVEAASPYTDGMGGIVSLEDATGTDYWGPVFRSSTTQVNVLVWNTSGTYLGHTSLSATVPFTWATSDLIVVNHWYRAG